MIPALLQNAPCLFLAEEDHAKTGSACLAVVASKDLVALAKDFYTAGYHLEDVCGLIAVEGAVSVYHFEHFDTPGRATVLVIEPMDEHCKATFPSIASVFQGAEWHERETRDFFGFTYEGNPNFIPLLLPAEMVDEHPLMKAEAARAPLAALFSASGRGRTIIKVAEGFIMLEELPAEAPPAPAPVDDIAPAAKPAGKPVENTTEKKAETPEVKPEPKKNADKPAVPKDEKEAGVIPGKATPSAPVSAPSAPPKKTAASSGKKGAKNA